MPIPRSSVSDFIAAAMEQPASKQKAILKLEKKIREIEKIAARIAANEYVDPLQREKVTQKDVLLAQLEELKKPKEPVEPSSTSGAATAFPVEMMNDAVRKLSSISQDVQAQNTSTAATSKPQSCATTVPGSNNSGASTPPQEDNSDLFWQEEAEASKPTRWSDDAMMDGDPDSLLGPRSRAGSRAWSEQIKQHSEITGPWRRAAKDCHARRLNSYASKVFAGLDTDGDGVLSSSELRVFATATGFEDEENDWDKLFEDVCMGSPETGMVFNDFNQLFKGLMADDQFRDQISEVYPESSMRQQKRPYVPRGNRPRFAKTGMNPSLMTFEEVAHSCTYEEVVRWCWQQGGYSALQYYLGSPATGQDYDPSMIEACDFADVYRENMTMC